MPAPDQVRGFNIQHPWIAGQARNDNIASVLVQRRGGLRKHQ